MSSVVNTPPLSITADSGICKKSILQFVNELLLHFHWLVSWLVSCSHPLLPLLDAVSSQEQDRLDD